MPTNKHATNPDHNSVGPPIDATFSTWVIFIQALRLARAFATGFFLGVVVLFLVSLYFETGVARYLLSCIEQADGRVQ